MLCCQCLSTNEQTVVLEKEEFHIEIGHKSSPRLLYCLHLLKIERRHLMSLLFSPRPRERNLNLFDGAIKLNRNGGIDAHTLDDKRREKLLLGTNG